MPSIMQQSHMGQPRFPYKKSALYPEITPTGVMFIYFKKYKTQLLLLLFCVLVGEGLLTGVSYVVKTIIDSIYQVRSGQNSIGSLYILSGIVAGMGLVGNLAYRMSGQLARSFFPYIKRDIRVDFFTYLHAHAHRYFSNHFG